MNKNLHLLGILLSASLCWFAFAEEPAVSQELTLEQALSEALGSSPKIDRAHSKAEEASWARVESAQGFLPTLTLDANHLLSKKYMVLDMNLGGGAVSIAQVVPSSIFTLGATLPLFDGFRSWNRYQSARAFEQAAESESTWARFQLEQEVTLLFYKALAAQVMKQVAQQNVQTLEDHLKDVLLFKKAGVSTNFDVLRVEVQTSEARAEMLNTIDNVEIARARLNEVFAKSDDPRTLSGHLPDPDEKWLTNVDLSNMNNRKDLESLEQLTQGNQDLDTAASRFWVPRIGLVGQYQYYNNRSDSLGDLDAYRSGYLVGLNLNWNLFEVASYARSRQAIEKSFQTQKTLTLARLHSQQELDMWRRKFHYQCTVFRYRQSDVAKASESVRLAKEGRKAGTRTNTDLLDTEAELFRAKAGLVNSQIGALEALSNLELTLGRNLP